MNEAQAQGAKVKNVLLTEEEVKIQTLVCEQRP